MTVDGVLWLLAYLGAVVIAAGGPVGIWAIPIPHPRSNRQETPK